MGGVLLIVLAALVFLLLGRRRGKPAEVPSDFVKPVETPKVEKPVVSKEKKPKLSKKTGHDPAKVAAHLDDLEKSYKRVEDMLKSMRGRRKL
jgi:hypothetical protein